MSTLSGLISAGGGGALLNIWIRSSQTWTPPFDGVGTIHVIGGGGPGHTSHKQEYNINGGGPAGGYARKEVTFSTSTNWTMTIGAGGVPTKKTTNDGAGLTYGVSAGGLSRAVATGYNILANGGALPSANSTGSGGGTASGGDVNYTGGVSGSDSSSFLKGKGGGAVATQASGGSTYPALANRKGGQNSDCIGPYDPSAYGQMTGGGYGGPAIMHHYYSIPPDTGVYSVANGGFLAGGGAVKSYAGNGQATMTILGGEGGIGGGGGFAMNTHSSAGGMGTMGGHGGQGIIFIQYKAKE